MEYLRAIHNPAIKKYRELLQQYEVAGDNLRYLLMNPRFNREEHGDQFWEVVRQHQANAIGIKRAYDALWQKYPQFRNALCRIGFPGSKKPNKNT